MLTKFVKPRKKENYFEVKIVYNQDLNKLFTLKFSLL